MAVFTRETMITHLRGREHVEWLESQVSKEYSSPVDENTSRTHIRAEMISAEIYHGLIWFLKAYPQFTRVRPVWEPFIEPSDRSILIRVRLEIDSTVPADQEDAKERLKNSSRTRDPLDKYYSYGDAPPSISESESEAFDTLIDLCEQIGPENWDGFFNSSLDKSKGYTSVTRLLKKWIQSWVHCWLALVEH